MAPASGSEPLLEQPSYKAETSATAQNFNCTLTHMHGAEYLCNGYGVFNESSKDSLGDGNLIWEGYSESYLVLRLHKIATLLRGDPDPPPGLREDSEWTRWTIKWPNTPKRTIDVTTCISLHHSEYMYIEASRVSNMTEPPLAWNASNAKLSTVAIRRQLNAISESLSVEERGLLKLEKYVDATADPSPRRWANGRRDVTPLWTKGIEDNAAITLNLTFEWLQFTFLNDIIEDTDRYDLVLQALITTHFALAYYNHRLSYDLLDNSTRIRMFVNALHSKPGWGYWTVTALLICHLGLMAVITACYLKVGGCENIPGSAWTAARQLQSEDINTAFECASTGTDREVKKYLRKEGIHERKIGLLSSQEGKSRIGVVAHSKNA